MDLSYAEGNKALTPVFAANGLSLAGLIYASLDNDVPASQLETFAHRLAMDGPAAVCVFVYGFMAMRIVAIFPQSRRALALMGLAVMFGAMIAWPFFPGVVTIIVISGIAFASVALWSTVPPIAMVGTLVALTLLSCYSATFADLSPIIGPPYPLGAFLVYAVLGAATERITRYDEGYLVAAFFIGLLLQIFGLVIVLTMNSDIAANQHLLPYSSLFISPLPQSGGFLNLIANCGLGVATVTGAFLLYRFPNFRQVADPIRCLGQGILSAYLIHLAVITVIVPRVNTNYVLFFVVEIASLVGILTFFVRRWHFGPLEVALQSVFPKVESSR